MCPFYANENPTYEPAISRISTITKGSTTTITTTYDHEYIDGTIVRLIVSNIYGMPQINNLYGEITVTGSNTFTIEIDSTNFDIFAIPGSGKIRTLALVVPIGESNDILDAAIQNVL